MSGNSDIPIFVITLNLSQAAVLARTFLEFFYFFLTRFSEGVELQEMDNMLNHTESNPRSLGSTARTVCVFNMRVH